MKVLITGVAGFIGGHLARACLDAGYTVTGIDCITPYYDPTVKRATVASLAHDRFTFVDADLSTDDLEPHLDGMEIVFHHAAQPGVRLCWSKRFPDYLINNVLATQRLLEAARATRPRRLVYASSSSVYGEIAGRPARESDEPRPHSPYGVTKLAGEHLFRLYSANWGLHTVCLRYFTVYGPCQRPDMAINRFIDAILEGRPVRIFGDGTQRRDFTYVDDVIRATIAVGTGDVAPGSVFNVAGGSQCAIADVLSLLADLLDRPFMVEYLREQPGEVLTTSADTTLMRGVLDWTPQVSLSTGLLEQVRWQTEKLSAAPGVAVAGARDRVLDL